MNWLLDPIANILGYILEYTDKLVYFISNTHSTGICIILFTFVVNMLMFPLTMKQQKTTKLSSIMNPEIQAIQAKYKGKKDNASMQKMQQEQQAVYDKYGVNPLGGCLPLLIQLPIFYALFRVMNDISTYVPELAKSTWFLGIDLSHHPYAPWNGLDRSFWIPLLAIATQYASTRLMTMNQNKQNQSMELPGGASMKMMNNVMPFVSGVFCLSMNAGIGLYWISGNIIRCVQSLLINRHFNNADIDKMIEANKEKAAAKATKRQVVNQRVADYSKTKTSNIKTSNDSNDKQKDYVVNKDVEKGSISGYAKMLSGSKNKDEKN